MPIPLLSLLPAALKAIAKVTGLDVVKQAGDALASAQFTPEQQTELKQALMAHEAEMARLSLEDFKVAMSESLAEIQSPDKFVSRARPFGVYAACVITSALAVALIAGVTVDTAAILTLIAPMWGQAAWYTFNRTREKMNGGAA